MYIYSLVDKKFIYPNEDSNFIYTGHSLGQKNNGKLSLRCRFKHCMNGQDNKQNISLGNFYKHGETLLLEIYDIEEDAKLTETI